MKHGALAVMIALGLGGCERASSTPTEVTVPWHAAQVGDREREVIDAYSTLRDGQPSPMAETIKFDMRWEVLSVTDGAPTRIKVRFDRYESVLNKDGFDGPIWGAVVLGKDYLLSGREATFTATDAKGGAVSDDEVLALETWWGSALGEKRDPRQVLANRSWKVGEKVALTSAERGLLHAATDGAIATLTLVSSDGKQATFELDATVDVSAPGEIHKLSDHATITVDTTRGDWFKCTSKLDKEFELHGERAHETSRTSWELSRVPASPAGRD